jgi:queuine/archaeosine tRNA-ribosyltransferase
MREAIAAGTFAAFRREFIERYEQGGASCT